MNKNSFTIITTILLFILIWIGVTYIQTRIMNVKMDRIITIHSHMLSIIDTANRDLMLNAYTNEITKKDCSYSLFILKNHYIHENPTDSVSISKFYNKITNITNNK